MTALIVVLLMIVLPLVHLALSRAPRTPLRIVHILLLYALVLGVGVIGLLLGLIPHVFFADQTAKMIGWAPGSPFQFEVGVHDGAWGVLGFLCIWIGGLFWLATGLGWSLFMLGATYGHIRAMIVEGNYAPYNFLTIFSDGFIAVWLLVLLLPLGGASRSKGAFPGLIGGKAGRGRGARLIGLPQERPSPIYSDREVGGRRVPRQPGQIRKEAALTRLTRVVVQPPT